MVEALRYREVDQDYRNLLQAYLNFSAKATKASGKKRVPVYRSFRKFYDYEAELEKRRAELVRPRKDCPYPVLRRYAYLVSSAANGGRYKDI